MKVHVKSFRKLPDGSVELKGEKEIEIKSKEVKKTKPSKNTRQSKKS